MFPLDKCPCGNKIIFYGDGVTGQTYRDQFTRLHYGEIVAWVDRKYMAYKELGVKAVESVKEINTYDYVIIAIGIRAVAEQVMQNLIDMQVEKTKIIWSV